MKPGFGNLRNYRFSFPESVPEGVNGFGPGQHDPQTGDHNPVVVKIIVRIFENLSGQGLVSGGMFLQHTVVINPPEPVGTDPGPSGFIVRSFPRQCIFDNIKAAVFDFETTGRFFIPPIGGQGFVAKGQ